MLRTCRTALLLVLVCGLPLVAQSLSIDVSPQAVVSLELRADSRDTASALGEALSKSLACKTTGAAITPREGAWIYQSSCTGPFRRHRQMLFGALPFAEFRRRLIALGITSLAIDVAVPNTPFEKDSFPKDWKRVCRNGVVHRSNTGDPRYLPLRTVTVAGGYRWLDLALMFAPIAGVLLLAFGLAVWVNAAAAGASRFHPRGLWFAYLRSISWGGAAIFLLWTAAWAWMTGIFAGEADAWALLSQWNGGSLLAGKIWSAGLLAAPAIVVAILCAWWLPASLAALRPADWRLLDSFKILLAPSLALVASGFWTFAAFDALGNYHLLHVFDRIVIAGLAGTLVHFAIRQGRSDQSARLTSGEVHDRLHALAARSKVALGEIEIVPHGSSALLQPVETESGRVALAAYVLEVLSPAEVEAEVARCWSLPLRNYSHVRRVLVFFAALFAGMLAALFCLVLTGLAVRSSGSNTTGPLVHLIMPTTVAWAVGFGWFFRRSLGRRSDRKAAVLTGNADAVTAAGQKLQPLRSAPWQWAGISGPTPAESPAAGVAVPPLQPPVLFSSAWRSRIRSVQAEAVVLALSVPPVLIAIAVRRGMIPHQARWPAYLAILALALLLRLTATKVGDWLAYAHLSRKILARMPDTATGDIFVGLSPQPQALVYDGAYDWDVGFLKLSAGRLDYRGEQTRFTLDCRQVTEIRLAPGSPHWSDPYWIYLSWRDPETAQEGSFPLILPRTGSPWKLSTRVADLYRTLVAWKNNPSPETAAAGPANLGLPAFPGIAGTPPPNQLHWMAATIVVGSICASLVARFPVVSEVTLYFALVLTANVLWDLFGHRLARPPLLQPA